jgi:hypothetical protein
MNVMLIILINRVEIILIKIIIIMLKILMR